MSAENLKEGRNYPDRSLWKSAGIGAVSFLIANQISEGLERLGIPCGSSNDNLVELFNRYPRLSFVVSATITPVAEEILFRFPVKLLSNSDRNRVMVGIASLIFFVLAHNITEKPSGRTTISFKKIPIPQLIGGFVLLKEVEKGGIINSIVAHSAWNTTAELLYLGSNALHKYRTRDKS